MSRLLVLLLATLSFAVSWVPAAAQAPASEPTTILDRALAETEAGRPQAAIALLEPLRRDPQAPGPALALLGILYLESGDAVKALAVLEPLAAAANPDPAVLFHTARAAATAGQQAKAEPLLERSAALAPLSPAARELGLLRLRQGRLGEALAFLGPWVESQPQDTEARFAATQAAVRMGRSAAAERLIAGLPEGAAATRLLKAELVFAQGDRTAALEILKPLLEKDEGGLSSDARGLAAEAHLAGNDPGSAIKLLTGKVGQDPQLSLLLARALRLAGRLGEAATVLKPFAEEVLAAPNPNRVSPFASAILLDYGRTLVASGRSREGATALERAVALNPASLQAWQTLAEAQTSLGETRKADLARKRARQLVEAQEKAVAASQAAIPGGANLGPLIEALNAGEPERALELARDEALRVPADPRPRFIAVRVLLSLNRNDEALSMAEGLVSQFPGNADAIYQRGALRMGRGDTAGGEQDLRQALVLAPDHPAAMNDLAVLLMNRKELAEAKKLLERVLQINPQDALAAQNLKRLQEGS